jgi:hypothetical protein
VTPGGRGIDEDAGNSFRHVLHINRLQPRVAAADKRDHREQPREMGERTEQRIAGSEHRTRADDSRTRKRFLDQPFAAPARANVRRNGRGIGADAGDENEASDTGSSRLARKRLRALLVHGLERYAARLDIGRDRIDDRVGPDDSTGDRASVTHVSAEDCDPVQARLTQRPSRLVGMPDGDVHSHSLGSEAPHDTLAEKPRAAEHAHRGHSIPSRFPDRVDLYSNQR